MSERGIFSVDRGIFEHPLLASKEPFSRLEAWLWLLREAAWKPRDVLIGGRMIHLERGQLAHSIRFMGEAWRWPKSKVERFLDRLKSGTLIGTQFGTGYQVITICKYNAYQKLGLPKRDSNGAEIGTGAGQERDKLESSKSIKEKGVSETGVSDPTPAKRSRKRTASYPPLFEEAWKGYPSHKNMSKAEALLAWHRLSAEDHLAVIRSLPVFRAFCEQDPTYPVLHFVRYLSKRRFEAHQPGGANVALVEVEDWPKRLSHARENGVWHLSKWGPMPGSDGCRVPPELVEEGDGVGWRDWQMKSAAAS